MEKLSQIDKKVLYELDLNSRQSLKQLAKRLKINRDTLSYKIKQFEEKGIIKQYYAVVDYHKLGFHLIRVYLNLQNLTKELEEKIAQDYVNLKTIFTVYKTEGQADLALGFFVKNVRTFYNDYMKLKTKYKKYIYDDSISFFISYVHYPKKYLFEDKKNKNNTIETKETEYEEVDELDKKILKKLSKNSRISLVELSNELDITSMAIHYRIKELERKEIIKGYKILIDTNKIGLDYYKVDFNLNDISKLDEIKKFAATHKNVVYEDVTVGGSDFEFDLEVESENFDNIVNEFKDKFPRVIRTYKYYKAKKIYKYEYFPEF